MKCPLCEKELEISSTAKRNMETYGNSCTARTLCCRGLVKAYPQFSYGAFEYTGDETHDDWGR